MEGKCSWLSSFPRISYIMISKQLIIFSLTKMTLFNKVYLEVSQNRGKIMFFMKEIRILSAHQQDMAFLYANFMVWLHFM